MATPLVTLREPEFDAEASILVGQGFNCFRWKAVVGGTPRELLWALPNFVSGQERPSSSGIPLLFPFPGRIAGGQFAWRGKTYTLEQNDRRGNAIHGFVYDRPWRVREQTPQRVTGEFHAWRDFPELKERWPSDFKVTATYELKGLALTATYAFENPGDDDLPWGFGTHAYFRLPLGPQSLANDCQLRVPAAAEWELQELLPTGRVLPLDRPGTWREGLQLGTRVFDNVLTEVALHDGRQVTQLHDPAARLTLTQEAAGPFRECTVYTPPHREAVCMEPYTMCPNAWSLAERGIAAGAQVLPPGGRVECRVRLSIAEEVEPEDQTLWSKTYRNSC